MLARKLADTVNVFVSTLSAKSWGALLLTQQGLTGISRMVMTDPFASCSLD